MSFAAQYLQHQNKFEIHRADQQLLTQYEKEYELNLKPQKTSIQINDPRIITEFTTQPEETTIKEYQRLLEKNHKIVIINLTKKNKYNPYQRYIYAIVPKESKLQDLEKIPPQHTIKLNPLNKTIQLTGPHAGPNGFGPPIQLNKKTNIKDQTQQTSIHQDPNLAYTQLAKHWLPYNQKIEKKIHYDDIPLGITEEGDLLLLTKHPEEPVIGAIGQRGSGKSWTCHAIIDRLYWQWNKKIIIANDRLNETNTWQQAWNTDPTKPRKGTLEHARKLTILNEQPRPLPLVYLHPTSKTKNPIILPKRESIGEHDSGYHLTLPYEEILLDIEGFGTQKKEWQLNKSLPYYKRMLPSLLECKNITELQNVIEQHLEMDPDKKKNLPSVSLKLQTIIKEILEEKFTDFNTNIPSKWTITDKADGTKKETNPVTACIIANLIPTIVTSSIKNKHWFPQYMKYILNDLWNHQTQDDYFIQNDTQLIYFIDELTSLDRKSTKTVCSQIIGEIAAEGRPARTGMIWATQTPEQTTERIAVNTTHTLVFRFKNSDQAKAVTNNFDLMKHNTKEILKLKPREMLACTSKSFKIITQDGHTRTLEDEPIKCFSIPTLSMHKAPTLRATRLGMEAT